MTTARLTDYPSQTEKASVRVLRECIDLQLAKSKDYQNDASTVVQADYYPRGVDSIYDMLNTKMLRIRSLLDTARANAAAEPKFESLRDTAKDLINYASFFAAWLDKGIEGQEKLGHVDMFNRPGPMPPAQSANSGWFTDSAGRIQPVSGQLFLQENGKL